MRIDDIQVLEMIWDVYCFTQSKQMSFIIFPTAVAILISLDDDKWYTVCDHIFHCICVDCVKLTKMPLISRQWFT